MSTGRIVGAGAYVAVVLLLAVAAWWLIATCDGRDPLVDEVLPAPDGLREHVEAWDGGSFSVARDRTAEERQTDLHIADGEPEDGIADVVRYWVKGLSAITTLLSLLGWLVGLASRNDGRRT